MGWDRTTQTGARAPGVEQRMLLAWQCPTESPARHRAGFKDWPPEDTNEGRKHYAAPGMPGAGLTGAPNGKAPPERPALKPYWGKPAVRNFRGDDGNVGIIRSPIRAITLPDSSGSLFRNVFVNCVEHLVP